MRRLLGWVIIILLSYYLAVMYQSQVMVTLFFTAILLPIPLLLLTIYQRQMLTFRLYPSVTAAEIGDMIYLNTEVNNRGLLPVSRLQLKIHCFNTMNGEKQVFFIRGMADARDRIVFYSSFISRKSGKLIITLEKVKIFDYLGWIRLNKKMTSKLTRAEVVIYPAVYDTQVVVEDNTARFMVESDEYHPYMSGDDPSEVFQIREYTAGDKMARVHWKLSAKSEDLLVKDYSLPIGCAVILFINGAIKDLQIAKNDLNKETDLSQAFLECALSLSRGILLAECSHYVAWFDKNLQDVNRQEVGSLEEFYTLMDQLLSANTDAAPLGGEADYQAKYLGETYSTFLLFDGELTLYKNDRPFVTLIAEKRKEMFEALELTV